ncbi:uncharacterized protein LOC120079962 isoform X2 [Benincasa hispida]|uniref:uncharacterized protein LOC120079962 isoform X2 n=1 Tax=Benincasa hispida TaxID=102211 RepID=UPI0019027E1D|nr:uncharacterized protein LOC120079962 isoform X2 [Benincasa hispida]
MPGTIKLSVLEFIDLPELLPSPISIKVSMGKRHYETSEKGEFSFPLTTLRDDVVLIVQDAGGNEISRAGVQAKSIVEKGYWDDLFPLEGGGCVHLQFQFALSEDDRSRIRMMRETALRRKHVEHQDKNLKSSGSNLASSFYLNRELSDSQKCLLQIGDLSAKEAAQQSPSASTENIPDENPVTEKTNNVQLDQNDADRNEVSPSTISQLQEVDANKPKVNNTVLVERMGTQSPHANKLSPPIRLEENLFNSQGSELSDSPSKGEEKTDATETPSRRRAPGNVKKVISAFESSLTQDTKPRIKPTLRNAHHSVEEKQTSLKVNQSKKPTEDNTKPILSQTPIGPPFAGDLTHDLENIIIKQKEQKRKFIDTSDGTKISEDPRQSLKLKGKKNQVGGEKLSKKDKMHKERDDIESKNDESYQKLVPEKPDCDRNSVTGESVSRVKDEQFPSRRSGGWIFPDERRRLCVTTGGNLLGGGRTSYTFNRKAEMKISMEENRGISETKANGGKRDHQEMIKPESSDDVKPSEGPLANALKIAIMVGFGTLVLFTRQRKKKGSEIEPSTPYGNRCFINTHKPLWFYIVVSQVCCIAAMSC